MENLRIKTPLGTLVIRESADSYHPGVWIDLERPDCVEDATLALIEYTEDDGPEECPQFVTRTWGNVCNEEYGEAVYHTGIEEFFALSE